jgi:hypothetical protein
MRVPVHGFIRTLMRLSIQKYPIFRKFKDIKELRGGVLV